MDAGIDTGPIVAAEAWPLTGRERAGDLYATRLGDDEKAIEQYEEGLARYPRAWNAPEVRRKLEALEKDRRL